MKKVSFRAKSLQVSNFLATFADENETREIQASKTANDGIGRKAADKRKRHVEGKPWQVPYRYFQVCCNRCSNRFPFQGHRRQDPDLYSEFHRRAHRTDSWISINE